MPDALKTGIEGNLEELNRILDGLARPAGKPFWSEGPRLSERLQDLFGQLNGVLAGPTTPQSAYVEELRAEYREKIGRVNRFFSEAAPALSGLLTENTAPGTSDTSGNRISWSEKSLRPFASSCVFPDEKEVRSK